MIKKKNSFYLILISCFIIETINQCTYTNNANCDPRCAGRNCNAYLSQLDCCSGCVAYGINYYN